VTIRILLLEDSDLDAELIAGHMRRSGIAHEIARVATRDDFVEALSGDHDLILADYSLPSFDGLSALAIARAQAPETPFIFVSGTLGEEIAIDSFKQGATDYVLKQRLVRLAPAVSRALAEAREKAERRQADAQLKLLVGELSHRVNNTLAIIQSIAIQTLRNAESLEGFKDSFLARLLALGKTHDLLSRANWAGTLLREILVAELEPYRVCNRDRCVLEGPDVELFPSAALTLALTFHELATNAAKYGALSRDQGRLHVTWSVTPDGAGEILAVTWREEGGPLVHEPVRRGFGSRLIRQSMAALGGSAEMNYAAEGLRCDIRIPLESSPLDLLAPNGVHVHLSTRRAMGHGGH
jgi:two-component sensor histidine kinase/CheY-like chemotaxis protein